MPITLREQPDFSFEVDQVASEQAGTGLPVTTMFIDGVPQISNINFEALLELHATLSNVINAHIHAIAESQAESRTAIKNAVRRIEALEAQALPRPPSGLN